MNFGTMRGTRSIQPFEIFAFLFVTGDTISTCPPARAWSCSPTAKESARGRGRSQFVVRSSRPGHCPIPEVRVYGGCARPGDSPDSCGQDAQHDARGAMGQDRDMASERGETERADHEEPAERIASVLKFVKSAEVCARDLRRARSSP